MNRLRGRIAWVFLSGFILSLVITLLLVARAPVARELAYKYGETVGMLYAAPLGAIIGSWLGTKAPVDSEISAAKASFAMTLVAAWNLIPLLLGIYALLPVPATCGAVLCGPTHFEEFMNAARTSAIGLTTLSTLVLTKVFPKADAQA